ncbi:MAG: SoxR reducing system RseC family protein [Gallionella sp.]|nr:SoxR reducing system RseC family protein [Gallionella sp.]
MLETRAIVVQVDGQYAYVQANQGKGCGQCEGKGCGAGKLSQLFCSKPRQFKVDNSIKASVGDMVVVSAAEGAVLRGIGLVYLLPLALLLAGAALGTSWASQPEHRDGYAGAGALSGLVVGFIVAKWVSSRQACQQYMPHIARQCGRGD